jgi:hypothetical protein
MFQSQTYRQNCRDVLVEFIPLTINFFIVVGKKICFRQRNSTKTGGIPVAEFTLA